jgi:hypothetical protein
MGKLRVDLGSGGEVTIRFPARTWNKAHREIESLRDDPPRGYKLRGSQVTPKNKSGTRCNLKMTFDYVDTREPVFTMSEAHDWFGDYARRASSGKDTEKTRATQP